MGDKDVADRLVYAIKGLSAVDVNEGDIKIAMDHAWEVYEFLKSRPMGSRLSRNERHTIMRMAVDMIRKARLCRCAEEPKK